MLGTSPAATRQKGQYKSVEEIFVGYYDNSKAYKVWIPRTHSLMKVRDVISNGKRHIEMTTIHPTNEDDMPSLWENPAQSPIAIQPVVSPPTDEGIQSIEVENPDEDKSEGKVKEQIQRSKLKKKKETN